MVGEPYKRVLLKEAAKAQFAAAVVTKAAAQVEDNMTNKEEKKLDE